MTAPVLLVGAGPGDPDLLTLRAEAALAAASTVVTDAVLADLAAAFAPRAAVTVAGDDPGRVAAALAAGGPGAVRLYRGDPWLHPACAAEAAALGTVGVAWEAVPGPAAALALAATAGLAVHHRPVSVCVTLVPPGDLPPAAPGRTFVAEVDEAPGVVVAGGTSLWRPAALMRRVRDARTPGAGR